MNVDDSEIVVSTSILRANRSDYDGGGVYVDIGSIQIAGCQVNYNRSGRHGGGVAVTIGSSAEITQCVFTGNASQYGGAISCSSSRNFVLLNSGVYGNMAEVYGGALRLSTLQYSVVANCTFADNRAFSGSFLEVLRQLDPPLGVSNCIVANGGQEIYSYEASTIFKHTAADGDSSLNCDPEGIEWGQGNISVDPCFVDPGYWDDNGTVDDPNDDFFVEGDYHLKSQAGRWDLDSGSWVQDDVTSPCIDAGDPNSPIMYEPFPNGGIINMGAYGGTAEASKSYFGGPVCRTIIAGDINGDCGVDIDDLILLINHWLETGDQTEE